MEDWLVDVNSIAALLYTGTLHATISTVSLSIHIHCTLQAPPVTTLSREPLDKESVIACKVH